MEYTPQNLQVSPNRHTIPPAIALSIAGSDSSAGAGIQADLKTFHTHHIYGLTAITGIVAETPLLVNSWQAVAPELLYSQIECLLKAYPIKAIKTGLLFNADLIGVIVKALSKYPSIPLIIDPVGAASSGTDFVNTTFQESLTRDLFPLSTLITPNLHEAQSLSNNSTSNLTTLATELAQTYQTNVLVKGGHSDRDQNARDVLSTPSGQIEEFILPRITGPDYHGTGCTLSAAITARLALGSSMKIAIKEAKQFLHDSINDGHTWGDIHALNTFRNS